MQKLLLVFTLLFISTITWAKDDHYECKLKNKEDHASVKKLKLKGYKASTLIVPFKSCKLTQENAFFDICKIGSSTLVIGINPTRSVLLSKKRAGYEFSCQEVVEQDEQEDEEEDEQQQEPGPEEPGHGGSNRRMRGVRTTEQEK